MDWFDPEGPEAANQVEVISRGLKIGGRVFLRSAALKPWYIAQFERGGFLARRVGVRTPGSCIDRYVHYTAFPTLHATIPEAGSFRATTLETVLMIRYRVNMYASAWILTKLAASSRISAYMAEP